MWKALVCLLSVLAVVSADFHSDECEEASYVPVAVAEIVADYEVLERGTNFQRAFDQLSYILEQQQTSFRSEIYYGLSISDNFYSVFDCRSPTYSNTAFCTEGPTLIFAARNFDYFGDFVIHYFKQTTPNSGVLMQQPFLADSADFFPSQRPWFLPGSGWTDPYVFAGTGITGVSYWTEFPGGVAAGDRLGGEPCGPCLTGSFPVPFALAFGTGNPPPGADAIRATQVEDVGKYIINLITGMTNEIITEAFVGYDNGYYVGIGDCRSPFMECDASVEGGWKMFVRNNFIFGNSNLCSFQLDADGEIVSEPICADDPFDTFSRPFFVQGSGWTNYYYSEIANVNVRSFSHRFYGGIAAADTIVNAEGRCVLGRDAEYEYDFYCGSSSKLFLSISLVLLSVLFALF